MPPVQYVNVIYSTKCFVCISMYHRLPRKRNDSNWWGSGREREREREILREVLFNLLVRYTPNDNNWIASPTLKWIYMVDVDFVHYKPNGWLCFSSNKEYSIAKTVCPLLFLEQDFRWSVRLINKSIKRNTQKKLCWKACWNRVVIAVCQFN